MEIQYVDGPPAYRAGACNIGPAEIARRRQAGVAGIGLAVLVAVALVALDAPAWTRLAVFPPLAGGLISLEQVRRRFCVAFAFAGVRDAGVLGRPQAVTDDADRAADRRTALRMVASMSAIAAVITVAFVLLPV
jgi:hypothetical protein